VSASSYTGSRPRARAGPANFRNMNLEAASLGIGWGSALVLTATLGWQVWIQWRNRSTEGVSRGLFAGQILASIGFVAYSVLVDNVVFVVTNSLILGVAVLGQCVVSRNRRLEAAHRVG